VELYDPQGGEGSVEVDDVACPLVLFDVDGKGFGDSCGAGREWEGRVGWRSGMCCPRGHSARSCLEARGAGRGDGDASINVSNLLKHIVPDVVEGLPLQCLL
jgi:hypothetical protein